MSLTAGIILWVIATGFFLWQHFRVKRASVRAKALLDRIHHLGNRLAEQLAGLEKEVRGLKVTSFRPPPLTEPGEWRGYVPLDLGG